MPKNIIKKEKLKYVEIRSAIVCEPRKEYFKGNLQDNIAETPLPHALEQHQRLVELLKGWRIFYIQEMRGHPNSVFVRDTGIITPYGYIKVKMALPSRHGEEKWMASFLDSIGIKKIGEISGEATCEGGDVIIGENVVFIGNSKRTNIEGVIQLRKIFQNIGYEVRVVDVPEPYLHLGGMMSILDDAILHCSSNFPQNFFDGYREIVVKCSSFIGGNVIYIGNKKVIVEKRNVEVLKKLSPEYKVYKIDLSEFIKGNGGPSCLILPVEFIP